MENKYSLGRVKARIVLDNLDNGSRQEIDIPESVATDLSYQVDYEEWGYYPSLLGGRRFESGRSVSITFIPTHGKDHFFTMKTIASLEQRYKTAEAKGKGLEFIKGLTEEQRKILLDSPARV